MTNHDEVRLLQRIHTNLLRVVGATVDAIMHLEKDWPKSILERGDQSTYCADYDCIQQTTNTFQNKTRCYKVYCEVTRDLYAQTNLHFTLMGNCSNVSKSVGC